MKGSILILIAAGVLISAFMLQNTGGGVEVVMYKSPACGCCGEYGKYLEAKGFKVKIIDLEDPGEIKNSLGVPESMWSCHTLKIGKYFVEGHVPVEAIHKLLEEQPEIDGIALPGMPQGSPGMSGVKTRPFIIYSISKGEIKEFIRI